MAEEKDKKVGDKAPTPTDKSPEKQVDKQVESLAKEPKAGDKVLSNTEALKDIQNDPKFNVNETQIQPDEEQEETQEQIDARRKAEQDAVKITGSNRPVINKGMQRPGSLGVKEEQVRIKIHSNEYEKGPVDVTVGNRMGTHKFSIPRDRYVTVPRSVVEVLKNTQVRTEVPDMDFHEKNPHPMDESPQMVEESHRRFGLEIQGEEIEE